MSKHTRQNRFAGTAYMKQRLRRGGHQGVTERGIIALDGCWCGEPLGHTWPGKDKGAPHPRGGDDMTALPEEPVTISRSDIGGFTKATQDLLLEIVNNFHVRYRRIDGAHLLLYPPDGESRPFKVSANRDDKVNKQILEVQFMQQFGLARPKKAVAKKAAPPKEQPVPVATATPAYEVPPASVDVTPPAPADITDAARAAIAVLTTALGIGSLETEALEALDEAEALKKEVASLRADLDRARSVSDSAGREIDRLAEDNTRISGLLDEAVAERDKATAKWKRFKEFLDD